MKPIFRSMVSITALGAALAACSPAAEETTETPPSRADLAPGLFDAGTAIWNLELTASVPPPDGFFDLDTVMIPLGIPGNPDDDRADDAAEDVPEGNGQDADTADANGADVGGDAVEESDSGPGLLSFANSDLAFTGDRVIMGGFHGFNVYDAANPDAPDHILSVVCPGGQGDVTVHGDLVFFSTEQNRGRLDCGNGGVEGDSSPERFLGVRIFDISDLNAPRQVAAVQTCRGSHTHTLVPHPTDDSIAYIYVQGTSSPRPDSELAGCSGGEPDENPDTALYSIDVIEVPLDAPERAAIVSRPRIFTDYETGEIAGLWAGGAMEDGAQATASTVACHDITVYPEMGLAGGACGGNGILLDITDPVNPRRISDLADPNMAYWHSATFSNDASKVLFTDEWGGGLGARCRAEDPQNWGANLIADIVDGEMELRGFFKIPGEQSAIENCVAHNGSLIPVPGRDIMVQGWYSGGLSIIDFTDSENPFEIAFFDRGPLGPDALRVGGYWAAYWHNGRVWAPEIARGLDVFRLQASDLLTANEVAAAELIRVDEANTQTQLHITWPDVPVVAHAYLDQLTRSGALDDAGLAEVRSVIEAWESGAADTAAMAAAAERLDAATDGQAAADGHRMAELSAMLIRAR
ncbi:LVIVD repeat-containing protein [Maricaulis sp.]|uniref:LVIVD repeat-containing protein n=1 Tax=Maricaulis sp. TaxID=1486257 RepID=UPI003A8EBFB0